MKVRTRAWLLALALVGWRVALDAQTTPNNPGRHDHTVRIQGLSREFIVYVPVRAEGTTLAPVVFVNHGTGGDGERFYNISAWRQKADTEGLIAVFPTALVHCYYDDDNGDGVFADPGERHALTKWNGGQFGSNLPLCTPAQLAGLNPGLRASADHPPADDVAFFNAMIDFILANYSIDRKRVYVTGFSAGSRMCGRLAVEMTGRLAAAGCAAAPLSVSTPASRPISVIASYGNADFQLLPYNGGAPLPLRESTIQIPRLSAHIVGRWPSALSLGSTYTYTEAMVSGVKTILYTFANSTVRANNYFRVALIDRLGHEYPNGENHPIVWANVLWEFFKDQQAPYGAASASAFGASASVAPGSWIEIYGWNLATNTRSWTAADFRGSSAPTSLDGTSVTIGGQAAFVSYISNGQVNAQAPSNVSTGAQQVTVTSPLGTASYSVTVNPAQPGLLAPPSFNLSGRQYVTALFPDGVTYVLPPGTLAGVASRRARPGDTITLYGIGFGPVVPDVPAGQVVSQRNELAAPLEIRFGETKATVTYAGLAPEAIGLYQFNIVVPNVGASDAVPLRFTLGGAAGVQTLFIAVEN